jgi:type II secretory ATPase GspE/PulE/Tfp pilus assembly ATPase PilB-like protein
MSVSSAGQLATELAALNPTDVEYATRFVETLLEAARLQSASDVHLLPTADELEIRWRVDGVLQTVGTFPPGVSANVIARIKVLADLLTYRTDVPQEGRIRRDSPLEMRVSTLPTLFGERAVVRLFSSGDRFLRLTDLGLPPEVRDNLTQLLGETTGAVIVTGPAGSGKTTTLYACLREILAQSAAARSIVTLEDPIEVAIAGVTQSQVNPVSGFDLAAGLRAVVRQDPEVIMVGEIRDRATAEVAIQASMTGQLMLSSFHAGSAAGAVSRLVDMGIEPYALRSAILAIISQRLVRKLCECAQASAEPQSLFGQQIAGANVPVGCLACGGNGYRGRLVLAEMLRPDTNHLQHAILSRSDAATIERFAHDAGMVGLRQRAISAVEAGLTSAEEIRRVLGLGC